MNDCFKGRDKVCSSNSCNKLAGGAGCAIRQGEAWFGIGPGKALRLMRDGLLVEYDTNYRAAIGVVSMDIGKAMHLLLLMDP